MRRAQALGVRKSHHGLPSRARLFLESPQHLRVVSSPVSAQPPPAHDVSKEDREVGDPVDVATRELFQVTNVLTGAYMPEPSPDGRSLVYVGYTTDGYDLFELALDRTRFLPAKAPVNERARPRGRPSPRPLSIEPYNPLPSLRPRAWSIGFSQGAFGNAYTLSTDGSDAIGRHAFAASLTIETEHVSPTGAIDYFYSRLPFGFRTTAFSSSSLASTAIC